MGFKNEVSFEQIKDLVNYGLSKFYECDKELLNYKTEKDAIAERCIVFHIGRYMLENMKSMPQLRGANLDCEYNRNFLHPKGKYKQVLENNKEKIEQMIPDLIIHKRKSNEENLLVVEFKKGRPSKADKQKDIDKLCFFTDDEDIYKYKYGLFICLYKNNHAAVRVFEKGKEISSKHYDWKIES